MIIAGIDYSLRSPAICILSGNKWSWENLSFYFLTDQKSKSKTFLKNIHGQRLSDWNVEAERYCSIADWTSDVVLGCGEVALEGYSYGSKGRVFHIAENTGVLKYKLYKLSLPLTIYTPSVIKKFATDKGNATKQMMYESFVKETNKQIMYSITPKSKKVGNPVSDIVDSYYICKRLFYDIVERKSKQ
jgi:Holliday junction resolvasome RuvABC endonuclease subunit